MTRSIEELSGRWEMRFKTRHKNGFIQPSCTHVKLILSDPILRNPTYETRQASNSPIPLEDASLLFTIKLVAKDFQSTIVLNKCDCQLEL